MLQRIQLYKLETPSDDGAVGRAARALRDEVARLPGRFTATVGLPADAASARSWDLALQLSFEDDAAAGAVLGAALDDAVRRALGAAVVVEKGWTFAALSA